MWNFSCSDRGRCPFRSPLFPLPSAPAFLAGVLEELSVAGTLPLHLGRAGVGRAPLLSPRPPQTQQAIPAGTLSWPSLMGKEEGSEPLPAEAHVGHRGFVGLALLSCEGPQLSTGEVHCQMGVCPSMEGETLEMLWISTKITQGLPGRHRGSRTKKLLVSPFAHVPL